MPVKSCCWYLDVVDASCWISSRFTSSVCIWSLTSDDEQSLSPYDTRCETSSDAELSCWSAAMLPEDVCSLDRQHTMLQSQISASYIHTDETFSNGIVITGMLKLHKNKRGSRKSDELSSWSWVRITSVAISAKTTLLGTLNLTLTPTLTLKLTHYFDISFYCWRFSHSILSTPCFPLISAERLLLHLELKIVLPLTQQRPFNCKKMWFLLLHKSI